MKVIPVWIVGRVVKAATFVPHTGASDDEVCDRDKIAQFNQRLGHFRPLVETLNFISDQFEAAACAFKPEIRSHDSNVIPHDLLDLGTIMFNQHPFLSIERTTFIPQRDDRRGRLLRADTRTNVLKRPVRKDDRLEERVAGESICSVNACHRDLAARIEIADAGPTV